MVFLDTNKLIFDQDPESGYKSVEEFLQKEFGQEASSQEDSFVVGWLSEFGGRRRAIVPRRAIVAAVDPVAILLRASPHACAIVVQ